MRARALRIVLVVLPLLSPLVGAPAVLAQAPPNDNFASAQALGADSGSVEGSNVGATKETGEPNHAGIRGGASVWYRWRAPSDGVARFNTNGSNFDTLLAVYQGASVSALTLVVADDDSGEPAGDGWASAVSFRAVAGAEYLIAVDGYKSSPSSPVRVGKVVLRWRFIPPPANDNFDQATVITGGQGTGRSTLLAATLESGEPHRRPSVWFRWTASRTGRIGFGLSEAFNIGVYTGSSLATLARVGLEIGRPITFSAVAGTTYSIAVTGSVPTDEDGRFALFWGPPPANDYFRNAQRIGGVRGRAAGTNLFATREQGEPPHFGRATVSVWYRWRAPRTGLALFTTRGSGLDTLLAAYRGSRLTGLRRLAGNDDVPCCVFSAVRFEAVRGVVYRIAVDGYESEFGRIVLNWQPATSAPPLAGRP